MSRRKAIDSLEALHGTFLYTKLAAWNTADGGEKESNLDTPENLPKSTLSLASVNNNVNRFGFGLISRQMASPKLE